MTKNILKRTVAVGCLALALICVVKTEEGKKKPLIMKQMTVAEEVLEEYENDLLVSGEPEDYVMLADETVEGENSQKENQVSETEQQQAQAETEPGLLEEETNQSPTVVEYDSEDNVCICVFGRARVQATPDSAMIFARIETLEKDIASSKENNFQAFENVVSAVGERGIARENIKLEFFGCQPSYDYSSGKTLNGYYSTTSFSICCIDIDQVSDYIALLTENGVTAIDNISYKVSDMEEQYNLALSQATQNARSKAEQMAGQELNLVKLKEEYVYSTNSVMRKFTDNLAPTDYIGKVEIEAQVMAVFEK